MDIASIFAQMLILFLTIGVGYTAAKCKLLGPDFNRQLSNLVIYFTSPALVLYSVIGTERVLSNQQVLLLTGISLLSYALLIVIAQVLPKLLRVPREQVGIYRFMTIFSNVGFMGFPVVQAIFGADAVFYAAIFQIPFNILSFTYGLYLIAGKGKFRPLQLCNPTIIATLLAYVLYLVGFQAPAVLVDLCDFIGQVTSPAAMIILGAALAAVPLRSVFTDLRCYLLSIIKLLVIPVALYLLLRPFVHNELILGITVVIMAMPVATNTTMLCAQYGGDSVTAAKGVFLSTLLSVATIPFLMWVLF